MTVSVTVNPSQVGLLLVLLLILHRLGDLMLIFERLTDLVCTLVKYNSELC